ncbi:hypothetical protein [Aliiroseovarius sp.]|uniref:COG3904 family protein n=1 Tax=Aliiroseovarius sp. TaxID=1872442 RepID=UPI002610F9F9|nr:hypothetical protein [Aliiroseovarius sp.]
MATRRPVADYLCAHWRGVLPVRASLWVNVVGLRVLLLGLGWTLLPRPLPSIPVLALIGADIAVYLWQAVGLVRHGDQRARSFGTTGHVWAGLLALLVALFLSLSIWWSLVLHSPLSPPRPDPLAGRTLPEETVTLTLAGAQLRLTGVLPIGIAGRVAAALERQPGVTTLVLDSPGGQIQAARGLADLVLAGGLGTHVEATCSSACTLVFMAGARRTLGEEGRLGFHSYALLIPSGHPNMDPATEMQRDLTYLEARGIAPEFLAKIPRIAPEDMWFPSRPELLDAGVLTE